MTSPHRIAFIGLGAMGYPMAGHLARAGHEVTVFNRTIGRAEAWQRDYINAALAMYDGNRTQTARILDVDPRTIFRHLERERGES